MVRHTPPSRPTRRRQRGWTLIELFIGLLVLALLAAVAVPTWLGQVRKLRRADAIAALLRLQQAQERWRTNQPSYASTLASSGLNLATLSPGGHYLLATRTDPASAASAYQVSAVAQGAQAQDAPCRYMRIDVQGGVITHQSGPDDAYGNTAPLNRRCWNE
jgi:type IV pilus assembly protein PilE